MMSFPSRSNLGLFLLRQPLKDLDIYQKHYIVKHLQFCLINIRNRGPPVLNENILKILEHEIQC